MDDEASFWSNLAQVIYSELTSMAAADVFACRFISDLATLDVEIGRGRST